MVTAAERHENALDLSDLFFFEDQRIDIDVLGQGSIGSGENRIALDIASPGHEHHITTPTADSALYLLGNIFALFEVNDRPDTMRYRPVRCGIK